MLRPLSPLTGADDTLHLPGPLVNIVSRETVMRPVRCKGCFAGASTDNTIREAGFQRQVSSVMLRDLSAESRNGPSEPVYPKLETWPFKSGNGGLPAKFCDIVKETYSNLPSSNLPIPT